VLGAGSDVCDPGEPVKLSSPTTRSELLRRLDRVDAARDYGRALELVHSDAERRFLEQRLDDLGD
jgi:predicted RNA polymerase sigma factor